MENNKALRQQIAIFDFGSQFTHLIARRIRELHIYSEIYSYEVDLTKLAQQNLIGVVFSGGPASVNTSLSYY